MTFLFWRHPKLSQFFAPKGALEVLMSYVCPSVCPHYALKLLNLPRVSQESTKVIAFGAKTLVVLVLAYFEMTAQIWVKKLSLHLFTYIYTYIYIYKYKKNTCWWVPVKVIQNINVQALTKWIFYKLFVLVHFNNYICRKFLNSAEGSWTGK